MSIERSEKVGHGFYEHEKGMVVGQNRDFGCKGFARLKSMAKVNQCLYITRAEASGHFVASQSNECALQQDAAVFL